MFKARNIKDNLIYTILSVRKDEYYNKTYFFTWQNGWKWIDCLEFRPPNVV